MTNASFRKLSVLGLVLMGASAVTAAILPKSNSKLFTSGHLEQTSTNGGNPNNDVRTCKAGWQLLQVKCDYTQTGAVNNQGITRSYTTAGTGTNPPGSSFDGTSTEGVNVNTGTNLRTPSNPNSTLITQ